MIFRCSDLIGKLKVGMHVKKVPRNLLKEGEYPAECSKIDGGYTAEVTKIDLDTDNFSIGGCCWQDFDKSYIDVLELTSTMIASKNNLYPKTQASAKIECEKLKKQLTAEELKHAHSNSKIAELKTAISNLERVS